MKKGLAGPGSNLCCVPSHRCESLPWNRFSQLVNHRDIGMTPGTHYFDRFRAAIEDESDLELRFECGQSIGVHSLKLRFASPVLKNLIKDVLAEQIESTSKRKRDDDHHEGASGASQLVVHLKVGFEHSIMT